MTKLVLTTFLPARKRFLVFAVLMMMIIGCRSLDPIADKPEPRDVSPEDVYPETMVVVPPPEHLVLEGLDIVSLDSGLSYALIEEGDGAPLAEEMHVSLHYIGYLENNYHLFDSSYERGRPLRFILGRGMVIQGWEEALLHLRVGDKARLWVPYELAYGEEGRAPIPGGVNLMFDVEVLMADPVVVPEMMNISGLDTLTAASGLKMIVVYEGSGPDPAPGHVLEVHYSGFLSDGTLFDSSVQRETPFRFVLGSGQVIKGLDEGFTRLKPGGKARLIVPPHLAYGDKGFGPVPPDETLFFDIVLLNLYR